MTKVNDWLSEATRRLQQADIATARLDALILLEDVLFIDRAKVLTKLELELTNAQNKKLEAQILQRARHIPLAYIRGKSEFYGREFFITPDVLQPRPESETIIELLKQLAKQRAMNNEQTKLTIIDIGTGSGALAVTAKLELPAATVIATDIDLKCLAVARKNAKKHGAAIDFYEGDLLAPLPSTTLQLPITLLANLPYVPDSHQLNQAAANEPRLAIFGGVDGLELYRKLFEHLTYSELKPQHILTESLPFQHAQLAKIASAAGFELKQTDDFIQHFVTT